MAYLIKDNPLTYISVHTEKSLSSVLSASALHNSLSFWRECFYIFQCALSSKWRDLLKVKCSLTLDIVPNCSHSFSFQLSDGFDVIAIRAAKPPCQHPCLLFAPQEANVSALFSPLEEKADLEVNEHFESEYQFSFLLANVLSCCHATMLPWLSDPPHPPPRPRHSRLSALLPVSSHSVTLSCKWGVIQRSFFGVTVSIRST